MKNAVTITGVHEVEADEPVYLIEIEVEGDVDSFDFSDITQEIPGQSQDNWQCAYDDREIDSPTSNRRFAFFFHYLDTRLPLLTSFGEIEIPKPSPMPARLANIEYDQP